MHSMTGFGRGTATTPTGRTVSAEVKTVNGRFLDVKVRTPRALGAFDAAAERLVRARLARGTASVHLSLDESTDGETHVDAAAARRHVTLLRELAAAVGIDEPVRLDHLLRFSDVFTTDAPARGDASADVTLDDAASAALTAALDDLVAMRARDGAVLAADLTARLDRLADMTAEAETMAPQRVVEARQRLSDRLDDLVGSGRMAPERIEQEIAILADRLDVTEETVRLRAHLRFLHEAIAGDEPPGRRLGFLVQEMGREVNTLGSKANDAAMQHLVVAMKEEIEKIKEQAANVE